MLPLQRTLQITLYIVLCCRMQCRVHCGVLCTMRWVDPLPLPHKKAKWGVIISLSCEKAEVGCHPREGVRPSSSLNEDTSGRPSPSLRMQRCMAIHLLRWAEMEGRCPLFLTIAEVALLSSKKTPGGISILREGSGRRPSPYFRRRMCVAIVFLCSPFFLA